MKALKTTSFAFTLLISILFIACSTDENINFPNSNNNNQSNNDNTTTSKKKLVKTINEYDNTERIELLTYSQGKLSNFKAYYNDEPDYYEHDLNITSGNNTMTLVGSLDDNNKVTLVYNLSNGLANSCKITYKDKSPENYTFTYSNEGYLTSVVCISEEYIKNEVFFTYENGNLFKVICRKQQDETYPIETETYTFSHSNIENKAGIIEQIFFFEHLFDNIPAFYTGILGRSPKLLPSKVAYEREEGNFHDTYSFEYTHILDKDGYVVNTLISNGDKWTYVYE